MPIPTGTNPTLVADILDYGLNTDVGQAIMGFGNSAYNSQFGQGLRNFLYGEDYDLTDDEYLRKHGKPRPYAGTTLGDMLTGAEFGKMIQMGKELRALDEAKKAKEIEQLNRIKNAKKVGVSENDRIHFVEGSTKPTGPTRAVKTFTLELPKEIKEVEETGRSLGQTHMYATQRYMECLAKGDVEGARNGRAFADDLKIKIENENLAKTGGGSKGYTRKKEYGGSIDLLSYKSGGSIHIKPENRGKFTEYCGGKVTEECIARGKRSPDPKIRKQATFAANSRSGNK